MLSETEHAARITAVLSELNEAADRLAARVEGAGSRAETANDGWTAAQIAAHVALVNDSLASVVDGSVPVAAAPAEAFVERPWTEIAPGVPARAESPPRFLPPDDITTSDAVKRLRTSVDRLRGAIQALAPARGGFCFTNRAVGTISLYQVGEFAARHMIRHNQQAKRVLGT